MFVTIMQYHLSCLHLLPLKNTLLSFSSSALHWLVTFNQICFILLLLNRPPPPLHWALLVIFGFGERGTVAVLASVRKHWHAASHRASLRQPESRCWIYLQPTCQLMLFVGVRRVGIASGIRTAKVATGDLKMGGGKPLSGCYNAKEVRQLFRKKHPTSNTGWE